MAIIDKNIANDDFWLNLSAESIFNSTEKRAAAVKAIRETVQWAFTLFSAGGFVIFLFGSIKEFHTLAVLSFGFAFFLLTLAYVQAGAAQFPVPQQFNALAPAEIKAAFTKAVATQSRRFQWAAGLTVSGFLFLAIGILILFGTVKKNKCKPPATAFPFTVMAKAAHSATDTSIPVTIMGPAQQNVSLLLYKAKTIDETADTNLLPSTGGNTFTTDTLGRLYHSFPVPGNTENVVLKVLMETGNSATSRQQYVQMQQIDTKQK